MVGVASVVGLLGISWIIVARSPSSRVATAVLYLLFYAAFAAFTISIASRWQADSAEGLGPPHWRPRLIGLSAAAVATGVFAAVVANLPSNPPSPAESSSAETSGQQSISMSPLQASPAPTSPTAPGTERPSATAAPPQSTALPSTAPPPSTGRRSSPPPSGSPSTSQPGTDPAGYGCSRGDVCLYPGSDSAHTKPSHTWFDYKVYNLKGVYGRHVAFNNQWGDAYLVAYEGYNGEGSCLHYSGPGFVTWNWTPINSIRLTRSLPRNCRDRP